LNVLVPNYSRGFEPDILSSGGSCTGNNLCEPGEYAVWTFTSLSAGESRAVQMSPEIFNSTGTLSPPPDGTLLFASATVNYTGGSISASDIILVDSNAKHVDSDNDGISDADELQIYGTDPLLADTDGDGLEDGVEVGIPGMDADPSTTTDPLNPDSDNDGRLDGNNGIDPCEDCNNNGTVDSGETNPDIENLRVACPDYNLRSGLNIISHPMPPIDLSCFDVLSFIGNDFVRSLQRFDVVTGKFETCLFPDGDINSLPEGSDFTIRSGKGYLIYVNSDVNTTLPGCNNTGQ